MGKSLHNLLLFDDLVFMRWVLLSCLPLCAFGQAPKPVFEVSNADIRTEPAGLRVVFLPRLNLAWDRMLRAAAPDMDFDHLTEGQIQRIKQNPEYVDSLVGYLYCVPSPIVRVFRDSMFSLITPRGIVRLQPAGMQVCARFGTEDKPEFHPENVWGEILAPVPAVAQGLISGFVIRTEGAMPVVSRGPHRFEASFSQNGRDVDLTCVYSFQGREVARGSGNADNRESLESWFMFRTPRGLYIYGAWKGRNDTCEHFYSIFQIDGNRLIQVGEGGDGCDV